MAGRHLATLSNNTTYYDHSDWLGTERARSTSTGSLYETCTSLPFGDWLTCSGGDPSPMHFTGKEHDPESGLDYFGARYDSSQYGRFMTPDAKRDSAVAANPQTLNRYVYALNNPLRFLDVGGECTAPALGSGQVGICVETYIRAARLGFLHLGLGDNRGPVANDPNATFRAQTLVTVDLKKQTVTQASQAGLSEIISKGFDPKRGSVTATVDNISIDSKGDISFEISVHGLNGQKAAGGLAGAFAPSGTIDAKFDFLVDPKGTVVLTGAEAKKYPSISVFSYSGDKTSDYLSRKKVAIRAI